MSYHEMTMAELEQEIRLLENELNALETQRAAIKQRKADVHQRIEQAQQWWAHRRMIEDPPDPTLTQGIGS